jgi:glycosyltransferase involved in cell wall biosynthesis
MTDGGRAQRDRARGVRVTVVIIFLNAERFLEEAIESVLAQTFTSWELVLVDDGSTDRSPQIADQYRVQAPGRVRVVRHPDGLNRGMSASRNLGIRHAEGELVAFLDADDVWLPLKLERQVATLDANPSAALVYGPTMLWHSWDGRPEGPKDRLRTLGVPPDRLYSSPDLVLAFLRDEALPPSTCGILVRRSVAERLGGFEERFRTMYEDQAFLYKLCLHEPVFVTAESWDLYRQHDASASVHAEAIGWYDANGPNQARREFLEWFREYAEGVGQMDPTMSAALADAFWPYRHPVRSWFTRRTRRLGSKMVRLLSSGVATP